MSGAGAGTIVRGRVAAVLPRFTGDIEQTPPMYSAVRVGGRRLHEAARRGEEVARAPRRVRVHALELTSFEPARDGLLLSAVAVEIDVATGRALSITREVLTHDGQDE